MGVPTTERTTAHLCIGDVMRSTQYYGQTRRFVVVDTTPKSVRVREIYRGRLGDLMVKRVREDGTFKLGPWQVAYLDEKETRLIRAYPQDFPW